jgi:hypothetical protein
VAKTSPATLLLWAAWAEANLQLAAGLAQL